MVKLEKLKELANKATPGPWFYDGYSRVFTANLERNSKADITENGTYAPGEFFYEVASVEVLAGDTSTKEGLDNAKYIEAVQPSTILKLIGGVELLLEALASTDCAKQCPEYCPRCDALKKFDLL